MRRLVWRTAAWFHARRLVREMRWATRIGLDSTHYVIDDETRRW